jgi:omega-amidase
MQEMLNIAIIQSNLIWENKEKNLQQFSQKIIAINEPVDLIVLPEMFTTGFSMRPELLAESMSGATVEWMKEMADKKKCVITGSFIAEEDGNYFNRLVWMKPDGTYNKYDKRHLFSMGEENNYYSSGTERIIVELKGWKICPLICYDLRFPAWSRNKLNNQQPDFDVLIYIANWPERRSHPWKTLLLSRAIENQCYVVGLNRVGDDSNGIYHSGDSAIINAKGEMVSKIKPHEELTETVALNYSELQEFRKTFPVLLDGDDFEIL